MKTYQELEREAYICGNILLDDLYNALMVSEEHVAAVEDGLLLLEELIHED